MTADVGFRTEFNGRLFDLCLGGGPLLDVGYTRNLSLAWSWGRIRSVESTAHLRQVWGGQLTVLSSAIRTHTPHEARIIGVEIDPDFHCATTPP